jgi:predicted transcriptional regulator
MLIVETIGRIRREHFVKGKPIKEIARDLGISRNTVRRILRSGQTSLVYERVVQPRLRGSKLHAETQPKLRTQRSAIERCHWPE